MLGLFFLLLPQPMPTYTRLAVVFLILPAIFFVFRKGEHLNKKKLVVVLIFCVIVTIIWDATAIRLGIWGFHQDKISAWVFGIPIEEYIFGLWLPITVLGIYTSLPKFKNYLINEPHFREVPLLGVVFSLQLLVWFSMLANPVSYIKWILFITAIPSIFYLWRKGERIDEIRLLITCCLVAAVVVFIDSIFVPLGAWYYNDAALLSHFGTIYSDDILFGIFNSIAIVGFYTSLPSRRVLTGKW